MHLCVQESVFQYHQRGDPSTGRHAPEIDPLVQTEAAPAGSSARAAIVEALFGNEDVTGCPPASRGGTTVSRMKGGVLASRMYRFPIHDAPANVLVAIQTELAAFVNDWDKYGTGTTPETSLTRVCEWYDRYFVENTAGKFFTLNDINKARGGQLNPPGIHNVSLDDSFFWRSEIARILFMDCLCVETANRFAV